jgi:hypothetical protein
MRTRARACAGWLLGICLVGTIAPPTAGDSGALTGAFANLEPGGRGAALAGALGPIVDSPVALHWNPAQLVAVERPTIEVTYADLFGLGLVRHTGAFLTLPGFKPALSWKAGNLAAPAAPPISAWGLGVQSTWVDLDPDAYIEYDLALGYARRSGWGFTCAVASHLLFVRSDVEEVSASGFAFDLALARPVLPGLTGSLVLRSLFSSLSWEGADKETLTPRAHLGASWQILPTLAVPCEVIWDLEGTRLTQAAGGAEWYPTGAALVLRGGLRWRDDGSEAEILPAAGLGLAWRQIVFDYGLALGREGLGDTHRFDLRYRF